MLQAKWRSLSETYGATALGAFVDALRPGHCVWDVGSHIGLYALLTAKRVGPDGQVVAWEPSPMSYAELSHHLTVNGQTGHCTAINEWTGDEEKAGVDFAVSRVAADSSTNRIAHSGSGEDVQIELRAGTLDLWAEKLGRVPEFLNGEAAVIDDFAEWLIPEAEAEGFARRLREINGARA